MSEIRRGNKIGTNFNQSKDEKKRCQNAVSIEHCPLKGHMAKKKRQLEDENLRKHLKFSVSL